MGRGTKNTTVQGENVVEPAEENTCDETDETVIDSEFVDVPSAIETDATVYTCQSSERDFGLESATDTQNSTSILSIHDSGLLSVGNEKIEAANEAPHGENTPKNTMLPNNTGDQYIDAIRQRRQSHMESYLPMEPTNADDTGRHAQSEQNEASRKTKLVTSSESNRMQIYLLSNFFEKRTYATEPQELFRRTFGVPTLTVKIEAKALGDVDDPGDSVFQPYPVWVSNEVEECISKYMGMQGFRLLCQDGDKFYFSVGNRRWTSANSEIDRIQSELRVLCFGRFYGRVIGGRRIDTPEDLLISFRLEGLDQTTWRFYFILVENKNTVVIRRAYQMQCRKVSHMYMYMYHLLALLCLLMKKIKGSI